MLEIQKDNILKNYQTKNLIIFKKLKEMILDGQLKPKQRIIIRKISSNLGVSETPVREALKMLQSEDLVLLNHHIGYMVNDLNISKVKNILVIRFSLEALAIKLSIENISKKEIDELSNKIREMKNCLKKKDCVTYGILNRQFHQIIYRSAKNAYLYKLINDLWDKSERMRSIFVLVPSAIKRSLNEHVALLDALNRKDKERIIQVFETHTTNFFSSLDKYIKKEKNQTLTIG